MSFQTMVGSGNGNGGYGYGQPNQPSGYGYSQPQPRYGAQPQQPQAPYGNTPSSPAYGSEFAHTHSHDSDPYTASKAQVALDIEQITLNYNAIRDLTAQINTTKDTVELRHNIQKKIEESNALGKRIQTAFRSLNSLISGNVQERREKKQHIDKLDATFTRFYNSTYGAEVRTAEELMRRYTPRSNMVADASSGGQYYADHYNEEDEQAGLIQAQRQAEYNQLANDSEYQSAVIRDRDAAIRALQREMSEVHDVFKDLANLVSEQGEMVGDIESNITQAADNTNVAFDEVSKAANYQAKGRNKLCIAAIVITILVAVVVTVAVLAHYLKNK